MLCLIMSWLAEIQWTRGVSWRIRMSHPYLQTPFQHMAIAVRIKKKRDTSVLKKRAKTKKKALSPISRATINVGGYSWSKHQDAVFNYIKNSNFDIIGIQKVSFTPSLNDFTVLSNQRPNNLDNSPNYELSELMYIKWLQLSTLSKGGIGWSRLDKFFINPSLIRTVTNIQLLLEWMVWCKIKNG